MYILHVRLTTKLQEYNCKYIHSIEKKQIIYGENEDKHQQFGEMPRMDTSVHVSRTADIFLLSPHLFRTCIQLDREIKANCAYVEMH